MNESNLGTQTLRDIGVLLIFFCELAWEGTRSVLRKVAPFVRPPADMEVNCRDGSQYTGAIMIEQNDIITGVVVKSGQEAPSYPSPHERPWSRTDERSREQYGTALRHWSEDPRDEEEPWRR